MKYQKECHCCGHVATAYTHRLNQSLVSALTQFVYAYLNKRKPLNLQKDINLTKNQYNNFQKLQYFELVKRIPGGVGWVPTQRGVRFIWGEMKMPNMVATINSKVLEETHEAWDTHNTSPKLVYAWEIDKEWKKREEYIEEKSNQTSFKI